VVKVFLPLLTPDYRCCEGPCRAVGRRFATCDRDSSAKVNSQERLPWLYKPPGNPPCGGTTGDNGALRLGIRHKKKPRAW
jgi:hypothetical protein